MEANRRPLEIRGELRKLAAAAVTGRMPHEVLVEGPAGTGKSFIISFIMDGLLWQYPGSRLLLCRMTRASLSESVLATLENKLWSPLHPCMRRRAARQTRSKYVYPNGSEIVLGGLNEPERLFSTEFDFVWMNEGCEPGVTIDAWEKFDRSLRNHKAPFQFKLTDVNPDRAQHFLNKRADEKDDDGNRVMHRIKTTHADNPMLDGDPDGYVKKLSRLTGVRRARLYEGKWMSAEGMVWDTFQADRHVQDTIVMEHGEDKIAHLKPGPLHWKGVYAGMDWGHRAPGSFELFAMTRDRQWHQILEVYQKERPLEWWKNVVAACMAATKCQFVVFDSAEPRSGEYIASGIRKLGVPCVMKPAKKQDKRRSFDVVRDMFEQDRLFLSRDSLRVRSVLQHLNEIGFSTHPHVRHMLAQTGESALPDGAQDVLLFDRQVTCLHQEIAEYVYPKTPEGRPIKEEPDPLCADHGCDGMRYLFWEVWRMMDRGEIDRRRGRDVRRRAG